MHSYNSFVSRKQKGHLCYANHIIRASTELKLNILGFLEILKQLCIFYHAVFVYFIYGLWSEIKFYYYYYLLLLLENKNQVNQSNSFWVTHADRLTNKQTDIPKCTALALSSGSEGNNDP